jgi:hypothetical protein
MPVQAITPYNDLPYSAKLWVVDVPTRKKTPYMEDDVRAYLTNDPDPELTPPDPSLVWDCDPPSGTVTDYLVNIPGIDLEPDALDAIAITESGKKFIFLIVESETTRSIRVVAKLPYSRVRYVVPT